MSTLFTWLSISASPHLIIFRSNYNKRIRPTLDNQEVAGVRQGIPRSRRRPGHGFPSVSPTGCLGFLQPRQPRCRRIPQRRGGGGSRAEAWHQGHGTPSMSLVTSLGMTSTAGRSTNSDGSSFQRQSNTDWGWVGGSIQAVRRCIREASRDLFKHSIIYSHLVKHTSYHSAIKVFKKKSNFIFLKGKFQFPKTMYILVAIGFVRDNSNVAPRSLNSCKILSFKKLLTTLSVLNLMLIPGKRLFLYLSYSPASTLVGDPGLTSNTWLVLTDLYIYNFDARVPFNPGGDWYIRVLNFNKDILLLSLQLEVLFL